MKWIGKLTGGVLGGLVMGPLGAALGVLLGHQFDEDAVPAALPPGAEDLNAIGERFFRATFRIMGHLAKADGRVSELEISAARAVMGQLRLDATQTHTAIECFGEGKQTGFDFEGELAALSRACQGRPDLTRIFLEIQMRAALAGNNLEGAVRPRMLRVAQVLGISAFEFAHVEAVLRIQSGAFRPGNAAGGVGGAARDTSLAAAYRVLETSAGASDEEVAKAYRRALHRHHPDKLRANGLPDSMIEHAKERTQQIIEAWELIRVQRGIR
jgi:DnaJ like chaperone protein